jgi:hypothetical protein
MRLALYNHLSAHKDYHAVVKAAEAGIMHSGRTLVFKTPCRGGNKNAATAVDDDLCICQRCGDIVRLIISATAVAFLLWARYVQINQALNATARQHPLPSHCTAQAATVWRLSAWMQM